MKEVSDHVITRIGLFGNPFESALARLYYLRDTDQRSRLYKAFQLTFDQYERELTDVSSTLSKESGFPPA